MGVSATLATLGLLHWWETDANELSAWLTSLYIIGQDFE